jgi:hypothetical protein
VSVTQHDRFSYVNPNGYGYLFEIRSNSLLVVDRLYFFLLEVPILILVECGTHGFVCISTGCPLFRRNYVIERKSRLGSEISTVIAWSAERDLSFFTPTTTTTDSDHLRTSFLVLLHFRLRKGSRPEGRRRQSR